jgi:hypothetical protein
VPEGLYDPEATQGHEGASHLPRQLLETDGGCETRQNGPGQGQQGRGVKPGVGERVLGRAFPNLGLLKACYPVVDWNAGLNRRGTRLPQGILSAHYDRAEECFRWAREQYLVKEVATDDILDAMVGAVTAMQYPRLSTLPENPIEDEEGIPMEMVYCSDF